MRGVDGGKWKIQGVKGRERERVEGRENDVSTTKQRNDGGRGFKKEF